MNNIGFLYALDQFGGLIDQFSVSLGVLMVISPIIYSIIALLDYINSSLCISQIAEKKNMGPVSAFVPFVREIYWHKVIGAPIWRAFFYGSWSVLVSVLLTVVMFLWLQGMIFLSILSLAYACVAVYVRFVDRRQFVESVCYVSLESPKPAPAPVCAVVAKVKGLEGQMKNQTFDISDGNEVVFGRDPASCNIVFDQFQTTVSRKHCSIRYIKATDTYILTNFSKNGVTCNNGQSLAVNSSATLAHGSVFTLGNGENKFYLV